MAAIVYDVMPMTKLALVPSIVLVACGSVGDASTGGAANASTNDGGAPSSTSSSGSAAGTASATSGTTCKRGIATNAAPSTAFEGSASARGPGVAWYYDWSSDAVSGAAAGLEFVPMIWGAGSLRATLPRGPSYVLGFNEPNFKAQSNLSATDAAKEWQQVQSLAKAVGAPLVSPAVNYCGSSSDSSQCSDSAVTDPYTWLKDFFAACASAGKGAECGVDAIAVHWYNCDLPSLQGYLDGNIATGGGLEGFVQFGKPIWLTEFACDGSHSAAEQKAYMQAAVPYLEQNAHVARYAWFSASIAPAVLANSDGTPNDLGQTYVSLAQTSCQ